MSGGIVVRRPECWVAEGMAFVRDCTGCVGAVGSGRIEGRRAIGCSCLWPLPASNAHGRCCRGTSVGKVRRCHVMDVGAVVGMVRYMRSACFSTTFVLEATDGGA